MDMQPESMPMEEPTVQEQEEEMPMEEPKGLMARRG